MADTVIDTIVEVVHARKKPLLSGMILLFRQKFAGLRLDCSAPALDWSPCQPLG